jgi:transcriptional regulator with XRE-family HTH domain
MMNATPPVGDLLRDWRQRRRLSQLELANKAEVSARHVSFLENGRSKPSREMLVKLAERLEIPLCERNALLLAGGFAPIYSERPLDAPEMQAARTAVNLVLAGHEPFPAVAVDQHWNLIASNRAIAPLLAGIDDEMLTPPINVMRLALHPNGLLPRTVNARQWRAHLLERLERQVERSGDNEIYELLKEVRSYPAAVGAARRVQAGTDLGGIVVPFRLRTEHGVLTFISTTTIFGTPLDITLSEMAIESFFPADAETAEIMRRVIGERGQP